MDSDSKFWGLNAWKGGHPTPGHKVMDGQGEDSRIIGYVTSGGPSPSKKMTGIALDTWKIVRLATKYGFNLAVGGE